MQEIQDVLCILAASCNAETGPSPCMSGKRYQDHVDVAVCSIDFFRETSPELQHPTPGGLSPAAIWLYRGLNLPLNALNAFWFYKMLTGALKVLKQAPSNNHKADGVKRS